MSKRVLLIDDDKDDAEIFEEALNEADNSAIFIYMDNPRKALDSLKNSDIQLPRIIFLDVNMPTMSGWECLREIKKNEALKQIPVIIYSTSSHQKEAAMAADLGAMAYLTKPHDYNELKKSLKNLINPL